MSDVSKIYGFRGCFSRMKCSLDFQPMGPRRRVVRADVGRVSPRRRRRREGGGLEAAHVKCKCGPLGGEGRGGKGEGGKFSIRQQVGSDASRVFDTPRNICKFNQIQMRVFPVRNPRFPVGLKKKRKAQPSRSPVNRVRPSRPLSPPRNRRYIQLLGKVRIPDNGMKIK